MLYRECDVATFINTVVFYPIPSLCADQVAKSCYQLQSQLKTLPMHVIRSLIDPGRLKTVLMPRKEMPGQQRLKQSS